MAFVDHEFALLSVGERSATRSGGWPAEARGGRSRRKPSRKRLQLPPGRTLRARPALVFTAHRPER